MLKLQRDETHFLLIGNKTMKLIGRAAKQHSWTAEAVRKILIESDRPLSANDIATRTELDRATVSRSFHELGKQLMCRLNVNTLSFLRSPSTPETIEGFHKLAARAI